MHNLPKRSNFLLPKYDLDFPGPPKDHIKEFILSIRLMNVQHEDVVCRIFPYTFENKVLTWYFNLSIGSITKWVDFQKDFLDKFGEYNTTATLMDELFSFLMGMNERFKDFNEKNSTLLNKFHEDETPIKKSSIRSAF